MCLAFPQPWDQQMGPGHLRSRQDQQVRILWLRSTIREARAVKILVDHLRCRAWRVTFLLWLQKREVTAPRREIICLLYNRICVGFIFLKSSQNNIWIWEEWFSKISLWKCSILSSNFICMYDLIYESESRSVVSNSLWPHWLYSPWNSPG